MPAEISDKALFFSEMEREERENSFYREIFFFFGQHNLILTSFCILSGFLWTASETSRISVKCRDNSQPVCS